MVGSISAALAVAAAGVAISKENSDSAQLPVKGSAQTSGKCAGKKVVVGAGFTVERGIEFVPPETITGSMAFIEDLIPSKGGKKLTARAYNDGPQTGVLLQHWGCSKAKGKAKIVSKSKPVDATQGAVVKAKCPRGHIVEGLGFRSTSGAGGPVTVLSAVRVGKNKVEVAGASFGQTSKKLAAIAVCRKGKVPKELTKTLTVKPGQTESTAVKCKRKQQVIFGGFSLPDVNASATVLSATRASRGKWKLTADVLRDEGPSGKITAHAYCR